MSAGFVHPDFGAVTETLRRVATDKRGGGGAVAVYHRGECVVDAWTGARNAAGDAWQSDTMAMSSPGCTIPASRATRIASSIWAAPEAPGSIASGRTPHTRLRRPSASI